MLAFITNRLSTPTVVFAALLGFVQLSGCASSRPTYTASGKAGHVLDCSGTARNWGMCLEKAGEHCGRKGYSVLERSDERGKMVSATRDSVYATTTTKRIMLIACN
ncbi:MAG: hypothetical protein EAZ30_09970 [Betaproteobacteria bacterium]|nr:MAG: hypothetical protein EAZ30_09970 [Betaproteobacteria bacterium]